MSNTNETPGEIRADDLYTFEEAARRLRWKKHSQRQAKKMGLQVSRFGSRDYVRGRAIIEFFAKLEQARTEQENEA